MISSHLMNTMRTSDEYYDKEEEKETRKLLRHQKGPFLHGKSSIN